MKKFVGTWLLLLLTLMIIGCNNSSNKRQISANESRTGNSPVETSLNKLEANLDKAKVVIINPQNIIWLETNDSSLLYDISNISHLNGRMLIQSRVFWKLFSSDGTYVGEVTRKGDAPEDFLWMGNIWNNDSLVFLYDYQLNKIQKYNRDGMYCGYDTIRRGTDYDTNPEEVYITKTDGVFYINQYLGCEPYAHLFCHAEDIYSEPKAIGSRRRKNGHTFYNRVYIDDPNHRLLYWEHINDTLYTVNRQDIKPLYIFDYGKYSVPKAITSDKSVVNRFLALNEIEYNNYAYPMRYFQVHNGKIYFIVAKRKQAYIGCIDEEKNKVAFTEFKSPANINLTPQLFFNIHGDSILLSIIDEDSPESNPGLLVFPVSELNYPE